MIFFGQGSAAMFTWHRATLYAMAAMDLNPATASSVPSTPIGNTIHPLILKRANVTLDTQGKTAMSLWIPATICASPVMDHVILTVIFVLQMLILIVGTSVYVTYIGQGRNARISLVLVTPFARLAMVRVHNTALLVLKTPLKTNMESANAISIGQGPIVRST